MKKLITALMPLILATGCVTEPGSASVAAETWLTTPDRTQLLSAQPLLEPIGRAGGDETITIDPTKRFQKMHGWGAAMTDASATLFSRLPADRREALFAELFGRENGGLGLSLTRLTVGASDFSLSHYSYDDTPRTTPDPELRYFSIEPARRFVLPRVREALAVNPELKVVISPWSAPAWMKTTGSMITGKLEPRYYPAFALYLARTVEAFQSEGVPVSLLTIQNEPDFEPGDYPGMRVSAEQRAEIIGRHVGPLFASRQIKTGILDWDHNWNQPDQPLTVLADPIARQYVTGIAWHCYEGDVPAQSSVHNAFPEKETWFTECSGGDWSPKLANTLGWLTDKVIIGAANHWSRGALLWNLALDPTNGPHTGGCPRCTGVVTIDPATNSVTRNFEYYVLGHASRFVPPGAHRISVTKLTKGVEATGFLNPDGSRVLIVHRNSGKAPLTIALDGRRYLGTIPNGAVATFRWRPPIDR